MIHSPACLAAAAICAIENLRDSDNPDWNLYTTDLSILTIAQGYLDDELTACRCPSH